MADVKISALTGATTPLAGTEVVPVVQDGTTKKVALTPANIGALPTGTKLDDLAAPDDNADLDASTTAHGLLLKATAPASGLMSVVGIANGETAYTNKALFDATNPAAVGTAAPGSAMVAARRDHVHAVPDIVGDTTPQLGGDLDLNGFQITGSGGTVTTNQPVLDLTQTWNNAAVAFTAESMAITLTAAKAISYLKTWTVNGIDTLKIGTQAPDSGLYSYAYLNFGTYGYFGTSVSGGRMLFGVMTGTAWTASCIAISPSVSSGRLLLSQPTALGWVAGTNADAAIETAIYRDAAYTLAMRNGVNAHSLRIYNTWTDASNHERLSIGWSGNVCTIAPEAAGTGTLRGLNIGSAASLIGLFGATPVVKPASADQAVVTLGNANSEIGGLTISSAYDQTEVQALRDKCEELADDVRALSTLVHSLRTALVNLGAINGAA